MLAAALPNDPIWNDLDDFMNSVEALRQRRAGLLELQAALTRLQPFAKRLTFYGIPTLPTPFQVDTSQVATCLGIVEQIHTQLDEESQLETEPDTSPAQRVRRLSRLKELSEAILLLCDDLRARLRVEPDVHPVSPPPAPAGAEPPRSPLQAPKQESPFKPPAVIPTPKQVPPPVPAPASLRTETAPPQVEAPVKKPVEEPRKRRLIDDLDLSSRLNMSAEAGVTLCLDFGTARSKAFATRSKEDDGIESIPLELGSAAGTAERNKYWLASTLWIDDNRRLYFGEEALARSLLKPERLRFDSIKDYLSSSSAGSSIEDPREITPGGLSQLGDGRRDRRWLFNPFHKEVPMTYGHLLVLFLGFLTHAAETALHKKAGCGKAVRRRFAIPSWEQEHRERGEQIMKAYLARAALVADAVGPRWSGGLDLDEAFELANRVLNLPPKHRPDWLLMEGLPEPVAASATRLNDGTLGRLVMVIDVGAGTSDFGLFRVKQTPEGTDMTFEELASHSRSVAGNSIDGAMLMHILKKWQHVDPVAEDNLRLELQLKIRNLKEQLFTLGQVTQSLGQGRFQFTLSKSELEPQCKFVGETLQRAFEDTLKRANEKGRLMPFAADGELPLKVVVTGGGALLPMVTDLARGEFLLDLSTQRVVVKRTPAELLSPEARLMRLKESDYLPLAVAWGGAMPVLPTSTGFTGFGRRRDGYPQ